MRDLVTYLALAVGILRAKVDWRGRAEKERNEREKGGGGKGGEKDREERR